MKENELVEVPLRSPLPTGQLNPLLAHWTYGLGRSVAFTSDAGRKWTTDWLDWEHYAAFWSQVVRWALRPVDKGQPHGLAPAGAGADQGRHRRPGQGRRSSSTSSRSGATSIGPDLQPRSIELVQTAPGKYEATIEEAEASGNYFVTLAIWIRTATRASSGRASRSPIPTSSASCSRTGRLEMLASVSDGRVIEWKSGRDGEPDVARTVDAANAFRRDPKSPPPRSFKDLWPILLYASALLFLVDVAVRRVAPDFDRMKAAAAAYLGKLRGRDVAPRVEYMEKLKSRKAEVGEQIDRTRNATRFEAPPLPTPSAPVDEPLLGGIDRPERPAEPTARPATPRTRPGRPEGRGRARATRNRLLKAKKKVWEERRQGHRNPERAGRPRNASMSDDPAAMEARAQEFRDAYARVKDEIGKVIVGHDDIVHGVLTCLFVGGHALLEGVPGLGKTLLVRTLADTLSLDFNRIQFTPDLMPADIIGTNVVMEGARRPPPLRVPARADLRPDRPGRRDQPGHAQDAVGPAGGHAGALGHRRRHGPHAQGAVLRHGHAEPDRAGGDLSPARGPARPLPVQAGRRLLQPRGADDDPRPDDPGREAPGRARSSTARRSSGCRRWSAR